MASDLMKQTVSISYAEVFLSRREEQGEKRINYEGRVS